MTSIVFRYIFKKLVKSILVIAPIVILMVWLTISIRHINLIITEDISILTFFKLILCGFPSIAGIILPICALISSIVVFYKMQNDKEIMVLLTAGKSKLSVSSPLFVFTAMISGIILFLQAYASPYSYKNSIDILQKIQNQISMSIVKPGCFNVIGDSVIYIKEKKDDTLTDVFISYIPKNKNSHINIITAKKGRSLVDGNNLFISLDQGYRQELDENNNALSTLKFDNFSYDVTEFVKKHSKKKKKPCEKTQQELLDEASKIQDKELKHKYIAEYHSRITIPFISVINSIIISIFMIHTYNRTRRAFQALKTFGYGIICQISIMTLTNAASKYEFLVLANYFIIFISIVGLLFISFKRKQS